MDTIDYEAIAIQPDKRTKLRAASDQFDKVAYINISDALANFERGGDIVLQKLDKEAKNGRYDSGLKAHTMTKQRQYKIKVLFDRFGQPVKKGDVVEWKFDLRTRDADDRKLSTKDIANIIRTGRGDSLKIMHAAEVDKDGCITVDYQDAAKLLNNWGMHYSGKTPISKMNELSGGPKKTPDGTMKHIHNWRFMEVPPTGKQ